METVEWPRFTFLPKISEAPKLAQQVAPLGKSTNRHRRVKPTLVVKRLGLKLDISRLSAARGGEEALLIPRMGGARKPFSIICDPDMCGFLTWLVTREGWDVEQFRQTLIDFRIAHELAHTFFYHWDPNAETHPTPRMYFRQRSPTLDQSQERPLEAFCDSFAYHLMCLGAGRLVRAQALAIAKHMRYNQDWLKPILKGCKRGTGL